MQISEIMEQIIIECRKYNAQDVILFGSRAKRTAKARSDFDIAAPREVLRTSFQAELIGSDEWMDMLKIRNELSRDYDGEVVAHHCQTIILRYVDLMFEFQGKVEEVLGEY